MKLKELEGRLQQVESFKTPKLHLEQFITTSHLASHILYNIDQMYDDIKNKTICDLGIGTGMLSIGCSLLEADFILGIDIDKDALGICQENIDFFEIDNIELLNCDCQKLLNQETRTNNLKTKFDTVIMNPPFGTKNHGIDLLFLKLAATISSNVIYSLHKTVTRKFLQLKSKELNLNMETICELKYNIPKVDNRNRQMTKTAPEKDISVDLIRFTKNIST